MLRELSRLSIDAWQFTSYFCVSAAFSNFWNQNIPKICSLSSDPVFYYQSSWAMSKLKLKNSLAEHISVGLMTVLIDMPYDIIGIKYVHWVWHDTDPNICKYKFLIRIAKDNVKVNFHDQTIVIIGCLGIRITFIRAFQRVFSSFFTPHERSSIKGKILGNGMRALCMRQKLKAMTNVFLYILVIFFFRKSEVIALIVASLCGMPGGCLLFIPFYHPLHDFFKVPSEVTSIGILIFFVSIVWKYDRKSNRYEKPEKFDFTSKLLMAHLIGHYLTNLGTAVLINPEDMISIGLHETVGNCNETETVKTVLSVNLAVSSIIFRNFQFLYIFTGP